MHGRDIGFRVKMHALFAALVIAPIEQDYIFAEQSGALPTKEAVRGAVRSERQAHDGCGGSPGELWRLRSTLDDDECVVPRRLFRSRHDACNGHAVRQADAIAQLGARLPGDATEHRFIELVIE